MKDDLDNTNYISTAPLSVDIMKTGLILEQLKKSIFKYKINDKSITGFLCKIPFGKEVINSLVMNYQIIDEKFIEENKSLKISFNDNKEILEINLVLERKKNFLKIFDITIIEIRSEDGINNENFLELDDSFLKNHSELSYKDESIYVLQYKEENRASVSYGLILEDGGNEIKIYSDISECSLGAPILNLTNNKVIGICKEFTNYSIDRKGINFKYVIRHIMENVHKNEINNENKNELIIGIKVENSDINKEIHFMYNIFQKNKEEDININIKVAKPKDIFECYIHQELPDIEYNEENLIKETKKTYYSFTPKVSDYYTIKIKFDTNPIDDCSFMFYNCDKIISIDFSSFDSSMINNMKYMFFGCTKLRYINFNNIKTKNVIDMEKMFYNCSQLNYLDLSNFNTKNVIYMDFMFYNTKNLERIIFSEKFDTTNVINMDYMFSGCLRLKELKLSSFRTGNVTNMAHMFYKCRSLKKLDLSNFNTESVTNMDLMFYNCQRDKYGLDVFWLFKSKRNRFI